MVPLPFATLGQAVYEAERQQTSFSSGVRPVCSTLAGHLNMWMR